MSWAEIKKAINSNHAKPLNELITELINASYTGRRKIYDANGVFTAPANVYTVYVTAIAAGGNGSAGYYGGGGGCGEWCYRKPVNVTPGNEYTIVVGSGNTSFSSVAVLLIKGESGSSTAGGKGGNGTGLGGFANNDTISEDSLDTVSGGIRNGGIGAGGLGNDPGITGPSYCKAGNGGTGAGMGGQGGRGMKGPRDRLGLSIMGKAGGGGAPIYFVGINGSSGRGGDGGQNGEKYGAGGGSGGGQGANGVMIIEW